MFVADDVPIVSQDILLKCPAELNIVKALQSCVQAETKLSKSDHSPGTVWALRARLTFMLFSDHAMLYGSAVQARQRSPEHHKSRQDV